jgi:proliferating cell nuclear antigen
MELKDEYLSEEEEETTLENPNNILEIETPEADIFKILSEALKDLFTQINIIFDKKSIFIKTSHKFLKYMVYVKLHADRFSSYYCKQKYIIGVHMNRLTTILSTITKDNTLKISMNKDNREDLNIQINDSKRSVTYDSKLKLLDLGDNTQTNLKDLEFSALLNMPSDLFKKICGDMKKIASVLEIKACGDVLIFTGFSDYIEKSVTVGIADNVKIDGTNSSDKVIQGFFELSFLCNFTKCTNLSDNVSLYLNNDLPMIIEYDVGSLGKIRCILVQCDDPRKSNS